MKTTVISKLALAAIAASTLLTSCEKIQGIFRGKDDKQEEKLTADTQKSRLDEIGEAFVNEFDIANWQSTTDGIYSAILAVSQIEDVSEELDKNEPDYVVAGVDKDGIDCVTIDFSLLTGHFTITENNILDYAEKGSFNDLTLDFTADGHSYHADVTVKNSNTVLLGGESYYFDYEKQTEVVEDRTYLVLPASVTGNFTIDGSRTFDITASLKYSGATDLAHAEAEDIAKINIETTFSINAGEYNVTLAKASFNGSDAAEDFSLSRAGKKIISSIANIKGISVDGETFDTADLALDILGQLQVKGSVAFANLYSALAQEQEKITDVETANQVLAGLKDFYDLGIYYDGGSLEQAWLTLKAFAAEEEGFEVLPVINFADGTTYTAPDFFTEDNFVKTIEALEALSLKIEQYIDSFSQGK